MLHDEVKLWRQNGQVKKDNKSLRELAYTL